MKLKDAVRLARLDARPWDVQWILLGIRVLSWQGQSGEETGHEEGAPESQNHWEDRVPFP